MKQDNRNIASDLIGSTVKVISRDGFDKASTRNIAGGCGIADPYIYLYFKDKEDLFIKAFQKEDTALARELEKYLPILNQKGVTNEDRFYFLFSRMWTYLIGNPDSCRFYVQYYYSPYYQKYSEREHLTLWMPVVEQMKGLFRPETEMQENLQTVLNTMLGQAINAATDSSADAHTIAQNNYRLILGMIRNCLLDS